MAVDVDLLNSNSLNNIQENFERVQTALQDAVSRSGNIPNQMNADLDMNSNEILNIKSIDTEVLYIDGEPVVPTTLGTFPPNSVGSPQIIDGSVTTDKLDDDSVTTDKLADGNVTTAKLDDEAVTFAKLNTGLVVTTSETIAGNNNDITIPTSGAVALHVGTARDFPTVAAIKAIPDPTKMTRVGLLENGREGEFVWKSGNYASRVALDPYNAFYIANDNIAATSGAYVRVWGGFRPPVTWAGAVLDGTGNYQPHAQSILDQHGSIFIPNGTLRCTSALQHGDDTYIQFESNRAALHAAHSGSAIEGKNKTTERRFFLTVESGFIYSSGSILSVGIDMTSTTYGKIIDTRLYQMALGWKNGGAGSLGAFYNEARGAIISSVTTGVRNGTLGNDIKMFGGSIKDCVVGTDDDDNSSCMYNGVAIETFTLAGSRVSNAAASAKIRMLSCRYENPSTSGAYASAIGVRLNPGAATCQVGMNYISTVATPISDVGVSNNLFGNA